MCAKWSEAEFTNTKKTVRVSKRSEAHYPKKTKVC
jgi:hypothetical protein